MSTREGLHIGWAGAVGVHAGRLLKRWRRSPASVFSTVMMPMVMLVIMKIMFSGMVEQFSGVPMNIASISVMIAVSQAFTVALIGAGGIVQERHDGLPDRLATVPGPRFAGMAGRILASSVISWLSMLSAVAVGLALGADFGSPAALAGTLAILMAVALASGSIGVMLGFTVDTPQGAMSFVPLVMVAMFLNPGMMPRELYAEPLRPMVDFSPVTAVLELMNAVMAGHVTPAVVIPFVAWFAALTALGLLILARKTTAARR